MSDRVEIPSRTGPSVWVGAGILEETAPPAGVKAERAAVLADEGLPPRYAEAVIASLERHGIACVHVPVPKGETAKALPVVERLAEMLAEAGIHRGDVVVGIGGGATTDVAGLVAATYSRGIQWIAVPTTLLGMVDASIGGKTAVNLAAGKNLLGAFHQPAAIVADVTTLATLPVGEYGSGMAEVVKHGLIADPGILTEVESSRESLDRRDEETLVRVVARAARVKVDIVDQDPAERGVRAYLNYGHTLGHALETLGQAGGGPPRRHGEAVAIGMMFAAHLARRLGFVDLVETHSDAIASASLPAGGAAVSFEDLAPILSRDKKWEQGLKFVVLEDLARPRLVDGIAESELRAAYEAVR